MAEIQVSLTAEMHQRITEAAKRVGLTAEQFVIAAVLEKVSRLTGLHSLNVDAAIGDVADLRSFLDKVPNLPVVASDELPNH